MFQVYDEGGQGSEAASTTQNQPAMADRTTRRHLKIMVCGDSMTHGEEGDHTWRYRVWEWFKDSAPEIKVNFVGKLGHPRTIRLIDYKY